MIREGPSMLRDAREVRQTINACALVVGSRLCRRGTIVDYSRNGLCLEGVFAVAPGERVTIVLLTGHRLPVVVAWAAGSRVGVRFVGSIAPGHPVLLEFEAAAERYSLYAEAQETTTMPIH
jgi:hypothetical protein